MKLLNYTSSYFAITLLVIISVWAALFYYSVLEEIYDSIDDGLDNQKGLILQKAARDSSILSKSGFDEADYSIREINAQAASNFRDIYVDTSMFMQNEQSDEPVRLLRTVFQQNGKFYEMQVATSMVEEDDLIASLLYALIWLYAGLLTSILILNNFLLKKIWQPFYFLLKQLKKFKLEDPSITVKKTKVEEFKLLNDTIQRLLQTNVDSYNSQKHFIENASHELQTPLAISINKLEALAETNKLSDEELKLLVSALDNLGRLTRLNKSLILLSRIENRQFPGETNININELVKQIADDFSDQIEFSKIRFTIDNLETLHFKMNPDLAAILVTNLLKNSIIHNHSNGSVKVIIKKGSLEIQNTATAGALHKEKMFTRFNKEKQSETSTGLGLAIIKAITDLYSLKIIYNYNHIHSMTVEFPE